MSNKETRAILLKALIDIRDNGPKFDGCGICGNVMNECDDDIDTEELLADVFAALGMNHGFPVDGGYDEYMRASGSGESMWTGEYGAARKKLLALCIDYLQTIEAAE